MSSPNLDTIITTIFTELNLPPPASYTLTSSSPLPLPSSFNLPLLITSSTLLSTLVPSLVLSQRNNTTSPAPVSLDPVHATAQFLSERLYSIDGQPPQKDERRRAGLHPTKDGYVRIHDGFPNHRLGALKLLGLDASASHADVSAACSTHTTSDLEAKAHAAGLPIYALRSLAEWSTHPQSSHTASSPIILTPLTSSPPVSLPRSPPPFRCLAGIRVLDLSRVIAAPSAGKHLAAHGADVLWITSPNLPDLPALDVEFSRGKRSIQLDLDSPHDRATLGNLAKDCDVFLQSYRPGSLANKGFSSAELTALNPSIVIANLSAFGSSGPWSQLRGFDSLVQTCTGLNVAEAEASGKDIPGLPFPCQALDHASGHLLAAGICAALYQRAAKGGSWQVEVSLAAAGKFLESMGRVEDGFEREAVKGQETFSDEVFEENELQNGRGRMKYVRSAGRIEGARVGWDRMPGKLGRDEAVWLSRD